MFFRPFHRRQANSERNRDGGPQRKTTRRFVPRIEVLEDRIALSTYVVNTTQDSATPVGNLLSLRAAIIEANQNPGLNTITFSLGSGTHVIAPGTDLPVVTNPLVINGLSQPGSIMLDGVNDNSGNGLDLNAGNCTVEGLSLIRFKNFGIRIDLANGPDLVTQNVIGTNFLGQTGLGNGAGLIILGSNNFVTGNGIVGNTNQGVYVSGGSGNQIYANGIQSNGGPGVSLAGASGNTIGGTKSGMANTILFNGGDGVVAAGQSANNQIVGNVISNNAANGVKLQDAGTTLNQVSNNEIGTDAFGTLAEANAGNGVLIYGGAAKNTVQNNLVSGNKLNGIVLTDMGTDGNQVFGNTIGTNRAGTTALPNQDGVFIKGGADNNAVHNNLISGNKQHGVEIQGGGPAGNQVTGNFIGTRGTGDKAVPNVQGGVILKAGAFRNLVSANLISGNGGPGVELRDAATTANTLEINFIGINFAGTAALPNKGDGVLIHLAASANYVGTAAPGTANLISGNTGSGVEIAGAGTQGNLVLANLIGTALDGKHAVGNQADGVLLDGGATQNYVGTGALISGNGRAGVYIKDAATQQNFVYGDLIGTDITGKGRLPNDDGVIIDQAGMNTIGEPSHGNVISGNTFGVLLTNGASGNRVQDNLIGTGVTGAALGNSGPGIYVTQGASDNIIGGTDTKQDGSPGADANTIAFNASGVVVGYTPQDTATGNAIQENSIFSSGLIGIDLGNDGPTANTPGGPHPGPNGFQNYPVIQSADSGLGTTDINFTLNSVPNGTFTVEFYATWPLVQEPPGVVEGPQLVGEVTVYADVQGNAGGTLTVPHYLGGDRLTATATGPNGTSEFSAPIDVKADIIHPSKPPAPSPPLVAEMVAVKVGKKRKLMVEVLDADTGAAETAPFLSPFQRGAFLDIQVRVVQDNGTGLPDQVLVTARKGHRTKTALVALNLTPPEPFVPPEPTLPPEPFVPPIPWTPPEPTQPPGLGFPPDPGAPAESSTLPPAG
jgi:titin